eukprot:gene4511-5528_t
MAVGVVRVVVAGLEEEVLVEGGMEVGTVVENVEEAVDLVGGVVSVREDGVVEVREAAMMVEVGNVAEVVVEEAVVDEAD